MRFNINRDLLIKCLDLVKNMLPNNTTQDILKTIYIEGKDDQLVLRANNKISDIKLTIDTPIELEGICCVNSVLIDIAPIFSPGDLLIITNGNKFTLRQGKKQHNLAVSNYTEFPPEFEFNQDYIEFANIQEFLKILGRLSLTIGTLVGDKEVYQGFYINPHLKLITSGDGHRHLSLWRNIELPGNITIPKAKMIMPFFSNLASLGENDKCYVSFGTWFGFRVEQPGFCYETRFASFGGEYSLKGIEAAYKSLELDPKLSVDINKLHILDVLKACSIYADRDNSTNNYIVLSRNGRGIEISMNIPNMVELSEPLECDYQGDDDFTICLNPIILRDAVDKVVSDRVKLNFFGSTSPMVIIDPDQPDYIYVQAAISLRKKAQ